jgi:hypothetical protein
MPIPLRPCALAAVALSLAACSDAGRYDIAGYRLPEGSLHGTTGIFYIHDQVELERLAQVRGFDVAAVNRRGGKLLGFWDAALAPACVIHLSDPRAFEHEAWHCKAGHWHK